MLDVQDGFTPKRGSCYLKNQISEECLLNSKRRLSRKLWPKTCRYRRAANRIISDGNGYKLRAAIN